MLPHLSQGELGELNSSLFQPSPWSRHCSWNSFGFNFWDLHSTIWVLLSNGDWQIGKNGSRFQKCRQSRAMPDSVKRQTQPRSETAAVQLFAKALAFQLSSCHCYQSPTMQGHEVSVQIENRESLELPNQSHQEKPNFFTPAHSKEHVWILMAIYLHL